MAFTKTKLTLSQKFQRAVMLAGAPIAGAALVAAAITSLVLMGIGSIPSFQPAFSVVAGVGMIFGAVLVAAGLSEGIPDRVKVRVKFGG